MSDFLFSIHQPSFKRILAENFSVRFLYNRIEKKDNLGYYLTEAKNMDFSSKVYFLRKILMISQEELANALGINSSIVDKWENKGLKPDAFSQKAFDDLCAKHNVEFNEFKSIELFAGAGGLALGLEKAGFSHIALLDIDKDATNTLKMNRPNWNVLCEDIKDTCQRDLKKEFNLEKGELDLLSGGAPCQSFSYAGKRLGLEDVRGTLFYYYANFLKQLQPKMFIFENVRGLLTHDGGKTFETILNIFEDQGYHTVHQVLNAWDYSVPQKRERLITIGIRKDIYKEGIFSFPNAHEYKPTMRDVKLDVNPKKDECAQYSEYKKNIFRLVPPGGYWKDIDPKVAKEYMKSCWDMGGGRTGILRRIGLDEPSLTVLTNPGMKQTDRCHPIEVRPFSYKENARIQTFPDDWMFSGNLSSKYMQVGNAVPVNLAKCIGEEIYLGLRKINNE